MQIYEIKNDDLNVFVKYKVLAQPELELAIDSKDMLSKDQYRQFVIESVIYNLSEVVESLQKVSKDIGIRSANSLYTGAIMLNPALDVDQWLQIAKLNDKGVAPDAPPSTKRTRKKKEEKVQTHDLSKKLTKTRFLNLEKHLKSKIIGQDEAIEAVSGALRRAFVGLNDPGRPYGVFIFAGASGVGKTHLARELHKYIYGDKYDIIRIDCGEYQHKHENSKLIGAPPGYLGYDEGGQLTNRLAEQPATVILLDEVEKAHPDIWNTFLRVFDEGTLTDSNGKVVSFKDSIIIMTTNLGNKKAVEDLLDRKVGFLNSSTSTSSTQMDRYAKEALRKFFSPELLNRVDKIVVFNKLTKTNLTQIAEIELQNLEAKLAKKGFSLEFDSSALEELAKLSLNSVENARKITQIRRETIENELAEKILRGRYVRGTVFSVTYNKEEWIISAPKKMK